MPIGEPRPLAERIRPLAQFLTATDAVRICIEREGETIELARRSVAPAPIAAPGADGVSAAAATTRVDAIKSDLVGIFRFARPTPLVGELLDGDRELAFVESLGIRNPVHSLGGGRIVAIEADDGEAVEYGQPLFLVDRG